MTEPRNCECHDDERPALEPGPIGRRDFFKLGVGGALSLALASRMTTSLFADDKKGAKEDKYTKPPTQIAAKAKSVVLLWLDGGPSQVDTFDPKGGQNGGSLKKVKTKIDGCEFTEPLAPLADVSDKLAVIRSMTSREGNHQRARYYLHTGYPPTGTLKHPSTGAVVSLKRDLPNLDIPHFVSINNPSFGAGFLGVSYGPFVISDPSKPPDNVAYAAGIDAERFDRRLKLLGKVDEAFAASRGGLMTEGKDAIYEKSVKMMRSPLLKAFDISEEGESVKKLYGIGDGQGGADKKGNAQRAMQQADKFGAGVLMARRLVEVGVPFVECTLGGWDTHQDNFNRVAGLSGSLAPAFAALIKELEDRKLLETTLVMCMGEFGRTPRINGNDGRDHFPGCFSVVMAGGGVKGGQVIGSTSDDGMSVADTPYTVPDMIATACTAMGIDHTEWFQTPVGRPIQIANKGKLIDGLLA